MFSLRLILYALIVSVKGETIISLLISMFGEAFSYSSNWKLEEPYKLERQFTYRWHLKMRNGSQKKEGKTLRVGSNTWEFLRVGQVTGNNPKIRNPFYQY